MLYLWLTMISKIMSLKLYLHKASGYEENRIFFFCSLKPTSLPQILPKCKWAFKIVCKIEEHILYTNAGKQLP